MSRKVKNLIEMQYDHLVVIKLAYQDWNGIAFWLCKCDCGNETIVQGGHLQTGHTRSCGCLRKEIMNKRIGKNHPNVKRNKNPNYIDGRTKAIRELKEKIRKRDKVCQKCKITQEECLMKHNRKLDVHHSDGDDTNNAENNMIVLCRSCHKKEQEKLFKLKGGD